jgi:hypothetical protein
MPDLLYLLQTLQSTYWLIILISEGEFFVVLKTKYLIAIHNWAIHKIERSKGFATSYS